MTLSDFIKKLQYFEQQGKGSLPVVLADWSEEYGEASERAAEHIEATLLEYWPAKFGPAFTYPSKGKVICIG